MSGFWSNKLAITILVLIALAVTVGVSGVGALLAFVVALAAAVIARKQGSFRDLGFRAPDSWSRLLGLTLLYGLLLQGLMVLLIEPLLSAWTGVPVDLSNFDGVRGNLANFLLLLAIGWVIGGFIEEFTFRGFVVGRVHWLMGSNALSAWVGVLAAAIPFGLAHAYQGPTGMISTGLTGFALGAVFVLHRYNLWYAIFTHGFTNTFGIAAIYFDIDQSLGRLVLG